MMFSTFALSGIRFRSC